MIRLIQLHKFLCAFLLTAVLLIGTVISSLESSALAAPSATNDVSNVKGESKNINGSYRQLQKAAHDFRNEVRDEQKPFFNGKSDKMAESGKAIKNAGKGAKNAFQRTADSIKDGLTSD